MAWLAFLAIAVVGVAAVISGAISHTFDPKGIIGDTPSLSDRPSPAPPPLPKPPAVAPAAG